MQDLLRPEWLDPDKKFAFPDWEKIFDWMERSAAPPEQREIWNAIAREWMRAVGNKFSEAMRLSESVHFILNAPASYRHTASCLAQLEDYRTRIALCLGALGETEWPSKSVVLIAPNHDDFVGYILEYHQEGEYAVPGGVYLNQGFGHFVLPTADLTLHSPVLAHELCHALIGPRDIPLWVNEAVTQNVEYQLTRRNPYVLDRAIVQEHRAYWNPNRMRSFWSGNSFSEPDEGSRLSYHLARFLLNAISQYGKEHTMQFVLEASCDDAGFGAAKSVLDLDLTDVVTEFLGEGEWGL